MELLVDRGHASFTIEFTFIWNFQKDNLQKIARIYKIIIVIYLIIYYLSQAKMCLDWVT